MKSTGFEFTDERSGRVLDFRLLSRLVRYVAPYRKLLALAVVLLIGASFLELLGPILIKRAVDRFILAGDVSGLRGIALLYGVVLIGAFGLRYAQFVLTEIAGQRAIHDLRTTVFEHLQRRSMPFFDRNPVGKLMTRVLSDVEVLSELFSSGVVGIFADAVMLAGIVAVMMAINPRLATLVLCVMPFLVGATWMFRVKVRGSFRKVRERVARLNAFVQEHLSGILTIQVFNRQRTAYERFDRLNALHRDAFLETILQYALFFPVVELVGAFATAVILYYGGLQIVREAITFGGLVAFIQYTQRFFFPIRDLAEKYNILQSAMASSERIFALLDDAGTPLEPRGLPEMPPLEREIEFRDVWFRYREDSDWVLRGVSFTVGKGESLAIVGLAGAGKTTLISLLCRFYEPGRGAILVDGRAISDFVPVSVRRRIGVIPQDVFLFSGSVKDNILLRREDAAPEVLFESARMANADALVRALPRGYDTDVRERGGLLSTGQKQLLAFARLLAAGPEVLVMDEATSSIDSLTESLIREAIANLLRNRTSIVIAHRLSTVQSVDRILVIHHGTVREQGNHRELLEQNGVYRRLYEFQLQDNGVLP